MAYGSGDVFGLPIENLTLKSGGFDVFARCVIENWIRLARSGWHWQGREGSADLDSFTVLLISQKDESCSGDGREGT